MYPNPSTSQISNQRDLLKINPRPTNSLLQPMRLCQPSLGLAVPSQLPPSLSSSHPGLSQSSTTLRAFALVLDFAWTPLCPDLHAAGSLLSLWYQLTHSFSREAHSDHASCTGTESAWGARAGLEPFGLLLKRTAWEGDGLQQRKSLEWTPGTRGRVGNGSHTAPSTGVAVREAQQGSL